MQNIVDNVRGGLAQVTNTPMQHVGQLASNVVDCVAKCVDEYAPDSVKTTLPQRLLSENVKHMTWVAFESLRWGRKHRVLLVLGYEDGFQVLDVTEDIHGSVSRPVEMVSKNEKGMLLLCPLPTPATSRRGVKGDAINLAAHPIMAYTVRRNPNVVHLLSLPLNKVVETLRPQGSEVTALQASPRLLVVGMGTRVDVYDADQPMKLFSVNCSARDPAGFALGGRWIAYPMTRQELAAPSGGRHNPLDSAVAYVSRVSQRTIDALLMPDGPAAGAHNAVAIRDVWSQALVGVISPGEEADPISQLKWAPSGLLLVSVLLSGHTVMVHRAATGPDADKTPSVHFEHVLTLNRGRTPAEISDVCVDDDGMYVVVSSVKGTCHVFPLPSDPVPQVEGWQRPSSSAARPSTTSPVLSGARYVSVACRVKLGNLLRQEPLHPKCALLAGPNHRHRFLLVCSKAGTLIKYHLLGKNFVPQGTAAGEMEASEQASVQVCRPRCHFQEVAFRGDAEPRGSPTPRPQQRQFDLVTHSLVNVPVWYRTKLSFHQVKHEGSTPEDVNAAARSGKPMPGELIDVGPPPDGVAALREIVASGGRRGPVVGIADMQPLDEAEDDDGWTDLGAGAGCRLTDEAGIGAHP